MLLEHPDIECALRTGYPRNNQPVRHYCEECGKDITDEVWYEDECHEFLCESCLLYFHRKD